MSTNTLYNEGEICTVVYGSSDIEINNNFYFPEKPIKELIELIEILLKKNDLLDERERKICT